MSKIGAQTGPAAKQLADFCSELRFSDQHPLLKRQSYG